jgi:NADH dehydrogenase FAD-containing subunit
MSELHEFINQDVVSWYPDLIPHIKLTLVEAGPGILGSFDKALSEYYLRELEKKNVSLASFKVSIVKTMSIDDSALLLLS